MSRSTRAFSLFEALCMMVTLCVFGWLCVGVVRHDLKKAGKDEHEGVIFTTTEGKEEAKPQAPKTEAAPAKASTPAPVPAPAPAPKVQSQPAGSPASTPSKP